MASLLYVFIWSDLVPTSPWGKLHPVSTAVLIVTVLSTRTHSVLKTHSSFHSCFPWLYVNCFQSPWFQCIVIESGGIRCEGCMFLKKAGTSRRGGWKKKGGLKHLSALCHSDLFLYERLCVIWCQLYNLKFKKGEKHPLLKVTLLHGCFHVFEIVQMVTNRA